ncbi:hypothetical protein HY479_01820 [Candidatus Uhrbacteria bacterium]|nr:hypothetical protein [Candidatus Uhrbacteria bacterium]
MGKVCLACGVAPVEVKKPMEEPEDCPDCGGKETVKEAEEPKTNQP